MKTIKAYTYLLLGIAISLMCACSEETFSPSNTAGGENVTISLSYSDVSPRDVTVSTRATDAEERKLNNLYIYIFDGSGNLKGFKEITSESDLNQNTSNDNRATITGIKTKTGSSYIYAVANINTGLYPVTTSNGSIEDGKLPVGLDESKAQAGEYADFTLDKLKALSFFRSAKNSIQISNAFLMSGAVNEGKAVTITAKGAIEGTDTDIRLSRIVSKVKFTIMAKSGDGITRSFKLDTYDIMNIALNGSLVGTIDGNTKKEVTGENNFSNITGIIRGVNDVDTEGREFFEVYIPENLQSYKNSVSTWNAREDDSQSTEKAFTNAPKYGTYVVLKGRYEEERDGNTRRNGDVIYYVHLGDCSDNVNDYNVERNCKYTFNITVAGVDKIIVEAEKKGNDQPGAEGVILEFGNIGKNLLLDSHYEYMVMRFYQSDIQQLKAKKLGFFYQVYALGQHTDVMNVGETTTGATNNVDTSWIQFAIKKDKTTSKYNSSATERGTACDYPGIQNIDKKSDGTGIYSIEGFLKLLYDKADNNSFWTGTSGSKYIDATCFVDENYYQGLYWDQYVNDVEKRKFYVANDVKTSNDGRSVYATAQYGLSQYNIQTFYDRSQSGSVVAYGCETINDEEGKNHSGENSSTTYDRWHGRVNFMKAYQAVKNSTQWSTFKNNKDLRYDCLSRNRDLNGDGKISEDEVRWYVPTSAQYAGLWIGEDVISTEAKLFNKSTDIFKSYKADTDNYNGRMLYYTNTSGEESFWSEEGMATGGANENSHYVRCVRNLKSNDIGYNSTPDTYFTWDSSTRLITLDKVDTGALNVTGETGELNAHNERQEGNKPASKFYVARNNAQSGNWWYHTGPTQQEVLDGTFTCAKNYSQDNKIWRVPNQREYCLMYIVARDDTYSGFTWTDLQDAYIKTKFSGMPFRTSWYCNYSGLLTMASPGNNVGYLRCISPTK